MIFNNKSPVGIISYGSKIPKNRISGEQIAKNQGKEKQKIYQSLGVYSKSVPSKDEDTITISVAAGFQALDRLKKLSNKDIRSQLGSLFIGSESHPYAVKPTGTVVAQALGISSDSYINSQGEGFYKSLALADLQFACKAGTQALQISSIYVNSDFTNYAMAIGADTAQAKRGDVLEYTAGAGGAAFIVGKNESQFLAKIIATTSVATDTPDFWRRPKEDHPEHAGRFTANPGYFRHILMVVNQILNETKIKIEEIDYFVFHTPNAKFPMTIAKKLGIDKRKIEPSLLVKNIGNTYAGASMLGLVSTLDLIEENKKILIASYGSGSGSDAFIIETTDKLISARKKWNNEKN